MKWAIAGRRVLGGLQARPVNLEAAPPCDRLVPFAEERAEERMRRRPPSLAAETGALEAETGVPPTETGVLPAETGALPAETGALEAGTGATPTETGALAAGPLACGREIRTFQASGPGSHKPAAGADYDLIGAVLVPGDALGRRVAWLGDTPAGAAPVPQRRDPPGAPL